MPKKLRPATEGDQQRLAKLIIDRVCKKQFSKVAFKEKGMPAIDPIPDSAARNKLEFSQINLLETIDTRLGIEFRRAKLDLPPDFANFFSIKIANQIIEKLGLEDPMGLDTDPLDDDFLSSEEIAEALQLFKEFDL